MDKIEVPRYMDCGIGNCFVLIFNWQQSRFFGLKLFFKLVARNFYQMACNMLKILKLISLYYFFMLFYLF